MDFTATEENDDTDQKVVQKEVETWILASETADSMNRLKLFFFKNKDLKALQSITDVQMLVDHSQAMKPKLQENITDYF